MRAIDIVFSKAVNPVDSLELQVGTAWLALFPIFVDAIFFSFPSASFESMRGAEVLQCHRDESSIWLRVL